MTRVEVVVVLADGILIHTSVKLVTLIDFFSVPSSTDFNPHEREARDVILESEFTCYSYFNPHEREARDEAEQKWCCNREVILIHTSVKLVT